MVSGMRHVNSSSLVLAALASVLSGACVTDIDVAEPDLRPPGNVGITPSGPPAKKIVRDLDVACHQTLAGTRRLEISATTDIGVVFAGVEFFRGAETDGMELSQWPKFIDHGGFVTVSRTEVNNYGNLDLGDSPVTCDNLPEFGVKFTVLFPAWSGGCALTGNADVVAQVRWK